MPLTFIRFYVANQPWLADLTRPRKLSRPLRFGPDADTWFGASPPSAVPLRVGNFVGSVRDGGSVNVEVLGFAPHCAGTHTEGLGHITAKPQPLGEIERPGLIPASVVTMDAVSVESMAAHLDSLEPGFEEALVIRSAHRGLGVPIPTVGSPNVEVDAVSGAETTPGRAATAFSPDALRLAVDRGVRHLLVEDVSVDPESDGGRLAAHRAFWGLPAGSTSGHSARTITELIRVPASVHDGPYLLDLQLPDLVTDAVPSRPILYPISRAE